MSEHAKERQIPLILIGAGLAFFALGALLHAGTAGVIPVLVAVVLGGVIQTILLIIVAFIIAAVLNVSFGDFGSAALKFAGAVLASAGIGAVIPVGGIVATFVFLGLILWLFELEIPYAVALMVVYFFAQMVVGFAIASAVK